MQRKIIKTKDNSKTLLIPELNETYHSTHGAITEAIHIYINNGIVAVNPKQDKISIFEMGFGTGLNAILTLNYANNTNNKEIIYKTIEKFPVSKEEIQSLDYINSTKLTYLSEEYMNLHDLDCSTAKKIIPNFTFTKYLNDIKNIKLNDNEFDVIYFDAFAPQHQPDLWSEEVMLKMYNSLKTGGFLITYCAQGKFKRTLKSVGFEIKPLDGPPGKREITKAIK